MMAREKGKGRLLPINPMEVLQALGSAEEKSSAEFRLSVLVDTSLDTELLSYAKEQFRPQAGNLTISVIPFFDEHCRFSVGSELVIVLAAEAPITGRLLIQALKERIPAVAVTLDPVKLQQIARENYNEIDLQSIVTVVNKGDRQQQFKLLFEELGSWIAREFTEGLLPLARALPFVREPFVKNAVQATALQNAAIGAVFFLPGSDMPLITLNQVKLFLQIAAVYGAELGKERIKELVVLLSGGLGFRAIARRLQRSIPYISWAIRGLVAYTGTLAIGIAAQLYFEQGGDFKQILETSKNALAIREHN